MNQLLLSWGLLLIIGFPILSLALGEGIERLERRKEPLAHALRNARRYLLPTLAIVILMRHLLNIKETALPSQIVQTVFWIALGYTALSLLNVTLTIKDTKKSWQIRVPNLLFQFIRILLFLCISAYVLSYIWKVDLNKVAEALGIGSLVIALALQDTLSNLVSGFLLLIESPFKVGDWLRVNDIEAEVIEMNWRAVRLKTRDRDIVIIPNGVLGQDTIYNYTLIDPIHVERIPLKFLFEDPPNRILQVLTSAALATEGVLSKPAPEVLTTAYTDGAIEYEVKLYIRDFASVEQIHHDFLTRVYYTAKRYDITVPYPISVEGDVDLLDRGRGDRTQEIQQFLRSLPYFSYFTRETIDRLGQRATLKFYGTGELIVRSGEFDPGFYIIKNGGVTISTKDKDGREQEVSHLSKSDFFGETVLLSGEPSIVSIKATDDVAAILIETEAVAELVQQNPRFAREINLLIEERRKSVSKTRGIEDETDEYAATNNKVKGYQILSQFSELSDT